MALVSVAGLSGSTAGVSTAEAATSPVTVSLTFDDGTADQTQAGPMLASHGMNGTFYIISGRVGTPGYLSLSDLQTLASGGNESVITRSAISISPTSIPTRPPGRCATPARS